MIALELKAEGKQGSCVDANRKASRTEDMKKTVKRSLTEGHLNAKEKRSWNQSNLMTGPKREKKTRKPKGRRISTHQSTKEIAKGPEGRHSPETDRIPLGRA
ncbi:hypothetical protein O6H91_10G064400 [Diphasiastrum complanatum]|uniref:Uncharacterized protein n=1 Tax=Diphasiastrum complanatum TaxID=34168 RepID=A0ACC2CHV8_DIPCM|nr:hypothetical protein O6H91_10G064400 [Diphasiastrum complanatum]